MRVMLRRMLFILALSFVTVMVTLAQGEGRTLQPGEPVTGTLDTTSAAQIYTFEGAQGDIVTLTLTGETATLGLTMILSDRFGETLGQAQTSPAQDNTAILADVTLGDVGQHYVTIFPTPGIETDTTGTFSLLLELEGSAVTAVDPAEVTPEPTQAVSLPPTGTPESSQPQTVGLDPANFQVSQVVLTQGITVTLTWNTDDDLNLQIRDPAGGTLFWNSTTTVDGGTFGPDVNGLCEIINTPPNVETASWSGGSLPTGSYEVLVYHRQACGNGAPVNFTLNVTVDGQALPRIDGIIQPPVNEVANVFITSFTVEPDGSAALGARGPYTDTNILPISVSQVLTNPSETVSIGSTTSGLITNEQWFETYKFDAQAGDVVTVEMITDEGNLDTLLLLINSTGTIVGNNDDIQPVENTNSRIDSLRLPTTGTYTILASRYGKDVGGTTGVYNLNVTQVATASDTTTTQQTQVIDATLPSGDIEVTLRWNTNADLQLLVRDPFGNAVFDDQPSVQSGGRLEETGNIACTQAVGPPLYYIYWPDGFLRIGSYEIDVWYQSQCGDTTPVIADLFVVVNDELVMSESIPIEFTQHYVTSFVVNQDGTTTTYPGGIIGGSETIPYGAELASALAISPGEIFTGSITPENKFDLYTFEGQVNDVVSIRMNATSQTLDTLVYLIDPNGAEIAANDDVSGDSTDSVISNVTLTQDGTYTIIATHYGGLFGGTTGGYNLNLTRNRATPES